jgi:hypothetical protein
MPAEEPLEGSDGSVAFVESVAFGGSIAFVGSLVSSSVPPGVCPQ